jgi:hypothetical protein
MDAYEKVTDERIERALAQTDITPEIVEWSGDPALGVTVRIETHMGRFMQRRLTPWMDDDALVFWLTKLGEDFDDADPR